MSVSNQITTFGLLRSIARKIFGKKTKQQCDSTNEVLFYGAKCEKGAKKIGFMNLFCINYVIIQANKNIDVCVPSLTSETIAKSLIAVQEKHIKIRVIIHNSSDFHNLQSFAQHGIEVKVINSAERLEHEFILIDGGCKDPVAIIGSLDYETSRVNCNRDATILTSESAVVNALKGEFDRIWGSSEHNYTNQL